MSSQLTALSQFKSIGSMRDVYRHFPKTNNLNTVLEKMGGKKVLVVTNDTLDDVVRALYSTPQSDTNWYDMWDFVANYYEDEDYYEGLSDHLVDYLNGNYNPHSQLAGDLLTRTFEEKGIHSTLPYVELMFNDSRLVRPLREVLNELGMSIVFILIDRDPADIDRVTSEAALNPEKFRLLIEPAAYMDWQMRYRYQDIVTELLCLTLVKSFSLSDTMEEFKQRFKALFETYLRTRLGRTSKNVHYVASLLSEIQLCYENDQGAEYYPDYKKAVLYACEVYEVELQSVSDKYPEMKEFIDAFFH